MDVCRIRIGEYDASLRILCGAFQLTGKFINGGTHYSEFSTGRSSCSSIAIMTFLLSGLNVSHMAFTRCMPHLMSARM